MTPPLHRRLTLIEQIAELRRAAVQATRDGADESAAVLTREANVLELTERAERLTGRPLAEWQRDLLAKALEVMPDGTWRFRGVDLGFVRRA